MAKHLYLHVPFCTSICYYCDFCHRLYDQKIVSKWLACVKEELDSYHIKDNLETIYVGGGTPSSLSLDELRTLLEYLKPYSHNVVEYTFEANPESLDNDKIKLLSEYHVNRISMGLQAIQDKLLKMMNRKHSFDDVKRAVDNLKALGIDNISLDLMYSLPNQSLDDFKDSLQAVIDLNIPHISLYSLTIEENSAFKKMGYHSLDDEIEADMYEMAVKYLGEKGYIQYEISNFAKNEKYSKHNLGYWRYDDFFGISLGASGKLHHQRYDNTSSFKDYFNHSYKANVIDLSLKDEMFEEIMMSLRTLEGLDLKRFKERYKHDFLEIYKKPYEKHLNDITIENDFLKVKNLELLNSLLVDFLD